MVAAATSAAVMGAASATASVEATASAPTAVTASATLRECGRCAEQRQRSNCCEYNL